jgi:enoyl-[acyl-carrier-protein] reductase (NADH)
MIKSILFSSFILIFLFASCQEKTKPKVSYDKTTKLTAAAKNDTLQIKVADLPINFEGTNFLIFPVGNLNSNDVISKYESGSRGDYDQSFNISNYNDNQITGYLQNIVFQEMGSDSIKNLSPKPLMIETVTYLKTVADKSGQQLLVYTLADADTNNDSKLDGNDIKSLYISTISGSRFNKLSRELNELLDWTLIESKNLLYFRTIEDTNKNGKFDKNDTVHYNYVSLSSKDWKVFEYNPI